MLVVIGSLKGSSGVSTTALMLAAVWPGPGPRPVVIEADCAGGDVGGRCWLPDTPGLASLATQARGGAAHPPEHATGLPCGVQVVVSPAGRHLASVAVDLLASADPRRWVGEDTVIVDVGRLEPDAPSGRLVTAADVLLVICGGDEASLLRLRDARLPAEWARLVLVGGSRYSGEEIAGSAGLPLAAELPWDARAAAVVWGDSPQRRGWTRRGLPAVARALAQSLDSDHRDRLLEADAGSGQNHTLPGTGPTNSFAAQTDNGDSTEVDWAQGDRVEGAR